MSAETESHSDPFIEEVRSRRRALCARYGNDLHKLCEAIRKQEAEHPEKVVDRRKHKQQGVESTGSS